MEAKRPWHRISSVPKLWSTSLLFALLIGVVPATVANSQTPTQQPTLHGQTTMVNFSSPSSSATQQPTAEATSNAITESRIAQLEAQVQSLQLANCETAITSRFYFGAAAIWAKPHFKEAFEYSQTNLGTGQQTLVPFEYDYDIAPKLWLGFRNCDGVGIKASYWNYDANGQSRTNVADGLNIFGAHAVTIIFPANIFAAFPGSTMQTDSKLEAEITDLYGTYDSELKGISVSGGVGLRYARIRQTLSAVVNGPIVPTSLNWVREYEGLGPSVALDMKKRLGNTRFSAIAKGSGALLYGSKTIERTVFGDQSPQPASPFLRLNEADEVVGIGEFGFGTEWAMTLSRGTEIAIAGTYEGQLWAEAGAPTIGFLGFQGFGFQAEIRR